MRLWARRRIRRGHLTEQFWTGETMGTVPDLAPAFTG
ncbi:hypothetical protein JOF53_007413 [Crossiella equi]|uniref:Uncharacterized protein n=1 Tax=Crossiella equi TaxID=130796 RepID=A0ABS5APQ1_9PSEU|nr:hypothetical protein [Crossiella equi]